MISGECFWTVLCWLGVWRQTLNLWWCYGGNFWIGMLFVCAIMLLGKPHGMWENQLVWIHYHNLESLDWSLVIEGKNIRLAACSCLFWVEFLLQEYSFERRNADFHFGFRSFAWFLKALNILRNVQCASELCTIQDLKDIFFLS